MVSSKFARSKHAFRVPDVCKKKKEAEEEDVYPPQVVTYTYTVDVVWLWFRYVFAGSRNLQKEDTMFGGSWRWMDDPTQPVTGVRARFQHNPNDGGWNASLWYWEGGPLRLVGQNLGNIPDKPIPLDTGHFLINFGAIWQGVRDGQCSS